MLLAWEFVEIASFPQLKSRVDINKTTIANLEVLKGGSVLVWDSSAAHFHDTRFETRTFCLAREYLTSKQLCRNATVLISDFNRPMILSSPSKSVV